jgi:predicted nucleotidyltransferase
MGTASPSDSIAQLLFGKTRRAVLSLLFGHADEAFYLRQIIRVSGTGQGTVQREMEKLAAAGLVRRRVHGRQVYFQANPACPVFAELKNLIAKTVGAADYLRAALVPLAERIRAAFIYGSVARGDERRSSDVDVIVVGEVSFVEVVAALGPSQERLGREVNPTVYREAEFRARLKAGQHFVTSVMKQQKIFLVGDEYDLRRLGQ